MCVWRVACVEASRGTKNNRPCSTRTQHCAHTRRLPSTSRSRRYARVNDSLGVTHSHRPSLSGVTDFGDVGWPGGESTKVASAAFLASSWLDRILCPPPSNKVNHTTKSPSRYCCSPSCAGSLDWIAGSLSHSWRANSNCSPPRPPIQPSPYDQLFQPGRVVTSANDIDIFSIISSSTSSSTPSISTCRHTMIQSGSRTFRL